MHVVIDGVSSSHKVHKEAALDQIKQSGGKITTSEAVLFQLLGDASDERFKAFLKLNKEFGERSTRWALRNVDDFTDNAQVHLTD